MRSFTGGLSDTRAEAKKPLLCRAKYIANYTNERAGNCTQKTRISTQTIAYFPAIAQENPTYIFQAFRQTLVKICILFRLKCSQLTGSHIQTRMQIVYLGNISGIKQVLPVRVCVCLCVAMQCLGRLWINPVTLPFQHSLDFINRHAMCIPSLTTSHSTVLYTHTLSLKHTHTHILTNTKVRSQWKASHPLNFRPIASFVTIAA